MGNPSAPVSAAPPAGENLLGSIPGQHLAAGSATPQPAESRRGELVEVTLDADWLGWVTVTYRSREMRWRGKGRYWAWVAVGAVPADGPTSATP